MLESITDQFDKYWHTIYLCGDEEDYWPDIQILYDLKLAVRESYERWLSEHMQAFSKKQKAIRDAGGETQKYQGWGYINDPQRLIDGEEILYHDVLEPYWAQCIINPDEETIRHYNDYKFLIWKIHPRHHGVFQQATLFGET